MRTGYVLQYTLSESKSVCKHESMTTPTNTNNNNIKKKWTNVHGKYAIGANIEMCFDFISIDISSIHWNECRHIPLILNQLLSCYYFWHQSSHKREYNVQSVYFNLVHKVLYRLKYPFYFVYSKRTYDIMYIHTSLRNIERQCAMDRVDVPIKSSHQSSGNSTKIPPTFWRIFRSISIS